MSANTPSAPDRQARQRALLDKLEGRLFRGTQLESPTRSPSPAASPTPPVGPAKSTQSTRGLVQRFAEFERKIGSTRTYAAEPFDETTCTDSIDDVFPSRPSSSASLRDLIPDLLAHETPGGETLLRRVRLSLDGAPGPNGVAYPHAEGAESLHPGALAALGLDSEWSDVALAPESIAFLDVETTGLSGGVGTYAFLIGIGYFDCAAGEFVVDQFYMEDLDREAPLIEAVWRRMAEFDGLVTYNGKAFDVPLLRTRCVFHRRPSVWEKPHIDLLHLTRRLWKRRLSSCSLSSIEQNILNVRRESDVSGAMVPQIYFDCVQGLGTERMHWVFDHHAQDIASCGALLCRLAALWQNPEREDYADHHSQAGLAGLFSAAGRIDDAIQCLTRAMRAASDGTARFDIGLRLGRLCKRASRWDEAKQTFAALLDCAPAGRVDAHIELAKHCEHRDKSPHEAMRIAKQAMSRLVNFEEQSYYAGRAARPDTALLESFIADLERRTERLARKIS